MNYINNKYNKNLFFQYFKIILIFLLIFAYPIRFNININALYFFDIMYIIFVFISFIFIKFKTNSFISTFSIFIYLYFLLSIISVINTKTNYIVIISALRLLLIFIISIYIPLLYYEEKYYIIFKNIIYYSGIPVLIFSFKQILFGFSKNELFYINAIRNISEDNYSSLKIFSTIGSPNTLAYFLIILLIYLLFSKEKKKINVLYILFVIINIFFSKMSVALICAFIIIIIKIALLNNKKIKYFFVISYLILVYSLYIFINTFKDKLKYFEFYFKTLLLIFENKINQTASMSARFEMIRRAISETNIFLGNGLGYISTNSQRPYIIDNQYIKIFSEIGIFGLLLFLFILIFIFLALILNIKKNKYALELLLILLSTMLFMFTSNLLDNTTISVLFGLNIGFSLINVKKDNK